MSNSLLHIKSVRAAVQTFIKKPTEGHNQNNLLCGSFLFLNTVVVLSCKDLLLVRRCCACSKVPLSVSLVLQLLPF